MASSNKPEIDMAAVLADVPLFDRLSPERIEHIAPRVRRRRLSRTEVIFHKGDQPQGLFVVVQGHVKLALLSTAGNEKVVELVGPGQCFGEVALLTGASYSFLAQAVRDVVVLFIPKDVIFELLERTPEFVRCMLTGLAGRMQTLLQDVETCTQLTSSRRVVGYLHQLCLDAEQEGDSIAITLPTSKQIVASRLNVAPETFSRILHELTEAKLIAVQGRQIHVASRERLNSYCEATS
jgi:CRP-like cAMP-binding protein